MNLTSYKTLIQAMPVKDQSFAIKAKNWINQLSGDHFDLLFEGKSEILLSREDILLTNRIDLFLIKTILWGYPSGMRGSNFPSIYSKLDELATDLNIPNRMQLNFEDLTLLQSKLQSYKGLGLSTYSKFLQLRGFRFDGIPALILDERIIRVFRNRVFQEFAALSKVADYNKERYYPLYLKSMNECAKDLDTTPEHLELFLFAFGNNLKGN